jgi:hypothetical protein
MLIKLTLQCFLIFRQIRSMTRGSHLEFRIRTRRALRLDRNSAQPFRHPKHRLFHDSSFLQAGHLRHWVPSRSLRNPFANFAVKDFDLRSYLFAEGFREETRKQCKRRTFIALSIE